MLDYIYELNQGWRLIIVSSCLCISGCFIIYSDNIYTCIMPDFVKSRYKFELKENYKFMNGSLSFSAGCLLFTSLFKLLPEALVYFEDSIDKHSKRDEQLVNFYLISSYICGIVICLSFNYVLHLLTSESVVHCNHEQNDSQRNTNLDFEHYHDHSGQHMQNNNHSSIEILDVTHDNHIAGDDEQVNNVVYIDENTPLVQKSIIPRKSIIHLIHQSCGDDVGECKGFSSAELCNYKNHDGSNRLHFCELPTLDKSIEADITLDSAGDSDEIELDRDSNANRQALHGAHSNYRSYEDHISHIDDHHHHINSPLSRLLLIGVQTTIAITMHKLPEGFITFITSETNSQLGFSIFLSLLLHNFTEGFSMCLPLYYSFAETSSKFAKLKALSISAVLGGISQPLGATIGYVFLKHTNSVLSPIDIDRLNFIFGITLAITSGFLTVIGLSMYGSAVSFSGSLNFVMIWCILGMSVIGLSSIISVE